MNLNVKIYILAASTILLISGNVYLWQSRLWLLTPITITFSLYGVVKYLNHILK